MIRGTMLFLAVLATTGAATGQTADTAQSWPRHVLITNDDGIDSRPMQALARAFAAFAEVTVVAPSSDRSGTGSSFSAFRTRFFSVAPVDTIPGVDAWELDGYPADCVLFALKGPLVRDPPDLVVVGPNGGANLGESWIASGTIGAARVAAYFGVPAIAISGVSERDPGSTQAVVDWTVKLARGPVARRLRAPQYLHVNIPMKPPDEIDGIRVVRPGEFIEMLAIRDTMHDSSTRNAWQLAVVLAWDASGIAGTDVNAYNESAVSIQAMRAGELDPALEAWLRENRELLPSWPGDDDTATTAPATDPDVEARTREVLAEVESYYAALSERDWSCFADHFWPGATLTTVWRPPDEPDRRVHVSTVPEFVERAPEGPGSRAVFQERMLGAEVRIQGDLAQVWARYAARFGDPGDITEWKGVDAFTLVRHDGRWRIAALAYVPEE